MDDERNEKRAFVGFSILVAVSTVIWCFFLGGRNVERTSVALVTCCAAFAVGSIFGFLFTIFGDEIGPFGKIQNAVVAVASGIAGIGVAKINDFGRKLGEIQIFSQRSAIASWFSVLFALTYALAGFYFMYLFRKLVLNPALAKARTEIDRIELTGNAEDAANEVAKVLTPGVLLGRDYVADIIKEDGDQAKALRAQLYSDPVKLFLESAEKDSAAGHEIPQDTVNKAAVIHYYRTYFQKEGTAERDKQEQLAEAWLGRALIRDPLDQGLNIKLADVYGMQGRYEETIAILDRLERDENAPQFVEQWLGYFLLFIEGRTQDAIRHSLEFYRRFPDATDGLFNAACGYAQLYTDEVRKRGVPAIPTSKNRKKSLELLKRCLEADPDAAASAKKYAVPGDSFETLASDEEFKRLIASHSTAKPARQAEPEEDEES